MEVLRIQRLCGWTSSELCELIEDGVVVDILWLHRSASYKVDIVSIMEMACDIKEIYDLV